MIQEVREDAARCRELIGQAAGAGSLVAKVVPDTLDDEQTAKYQAVKDGRRDCRWQAAVAMVLDRLDETLGFTQRQHDTLTAALLAASPAAGRHVAGYREHRQAERRWACGRGVCHGLLRYSGEAPLARHLADCMGETDGPGGGGVSARVPELWRRHPADRVHHGAGADPEAVCAEGRIQRVRRLFLTFFCSLRGG